MPVRVALASGVPLQEGTFVARPSQLVVEAQINGRNVLAHMADRGRLHGLLYPNARLLLAPRSGTHRKTAYQVVAVYADKELVSLDTLLPNRLVAAALAKGALPQFARYDTIQPEVRVGHHRFDFRLSQGLHSCMIEVKSVGQVVDNLAMFPDAPTERGRRHVEVLMDMTNKGQRTAIIFIVQRSGGRAFVPNEQTDPLFARALRRAIAAGVEVYAYRCPLTPLGITLGEQLHSFGSINAIPDVQQ